MKHYFVICSLLLVALQVCGQGQPAFRQYTMDEGLPCNTVYEMVQDAKGYIWMASEHGLIRYDGTSFKTYTVNDGLDDNDLIGIALDREDQIWALSYRGTLSMMVGEVFQSPSTGIPFTGIQAIMNHPEGDFSIYQQPFWIHKEGKQHSMLKLRFGESMVKDGRGRVVFRRGDSVFVDGKARCSLEDVQFPVGLVYDQSNRVFMVNHQHVYSLDPCPEIIHSFSPSIPQSKSLRVRMDRNGGLYILTMQGIYVLGREGKLEHWFPEMNISNLLEDFEGNLWFSTLEDGVLMIPDSRIAYHTPEEGFPVYKIREDEQGKVWMGSDHGRGAVWDDSLSMFEFEGQDRDRCLDIGVSPEGELVLLYDQWMLKEGEKWIPRVPEVVYKSIVWGSEDEFFFSTTKGVFQCNTEDFESEIIHRLERPLPAEKLLDSLSICSERATDLYYDEQRAQLLIGSVEGLFIFTGDSLKPPSATLIHQRVTDIARLQDGIYLLGTSGAGLIAFRDSILYVVQEKDGLASNSINQVSVDSLGKVWLATNQGIHMLEGPFDQQKFVQIHHLGRQHGLPENLIYDCIRQGDRIWAGSSKGAFSFPVSLLEDKLTPPKMVLEQLRVNGEERSPAQSLTMDYGDALEVGFAGISFLNGSDLHYRYRLGTTWNRIDARNLSFPRLEPGNAQLFIQAVDPSGQLSAPLVIGINVSTPFWMTTWFYALLIGLGFLVVILIFNWLAHNQRQKTARLQRIKELESMALRAQMNPHFVFNSLNAIHAFIARQDQRTAHDFLARFARLTRNTLDASLSSLVPLKKELESLQLYLELEKMRFGDSFSFEIHRDLKESSALLEVPPMLIQPLLENAILHGLRHLTDRLGLVTLHLKEGDTGLYVEVIDNGIGRDASRANQTNDFGKHRSYGSRILVDRIALIEGAQIEFHDLRHPDGSAAGTSCKLFLPF